MKLAAAALLIAGASAFAPAPNSHRAMTALSAEKSQALPFMNKPELVSSRPLGV